MTMGMSSSVCCASSVMLCSICVKLSAVSGRSVRVLSVKSEGTGKCEESEAFVFSLLGRKECSPWNMRSLGVWRVVCS